jgi:hypothetical protein
VIPKMEKSLIISSYHELAMNADYRKPVMIAVVAFLAIMLIYSSCSAASTVFAKAPAPGYLSSDNCNWIHIIDAGGKLTCCWKEPGQTVTSCQTCSCPTSGECTQTNLECGDVKVSEFLTGDLPQLETVPPNRTLPFGGDLPTLGPTLEPGPGFNQGTEGEPPLPVICSEEAGLEKDPETGQCVPIEPEAPEQPEEAEGPPKEEQPSGEDSSDN